MIQYRPFRNCDPPALAHIWRSQPPSALRLGRLTAGTLEQYVFSKPYFDPAGLIVAVEGEKVIGFAHAGFGANEALSGLCRDLGVVSMVMLQPGEAQQHVGRGLLGRAEDYLKLGGAKVIYGGGIHPINPFYLGLYGGSELPGVLASDGPLLELFQSGGYREIDRVVILERDLASFRPPVDRRLIQIRRQYGVEATFDPPAANWWEACQYASSDRTRFVLRSPREPAAAATVTFWDMEPLAASWGVHAAGLTDLTTREPLRRQGLATLLVSEALRQLCAHGIARCQVQCMAANAAARGLYRKLGFAEVDQGVVLRKE